MDGGYQTLPAIAHVRRKMTLTMHYPVLRVVTWLWGIIVFVIWKRSLCEKYAQMLGLSTLDGAACYQRDRFGLAPVTFIRNLTRLWTRFSCWWIKSSLCWTNVGTTISPMTILTPVFTNSCKLSAFELSATEQLPSYHRSLMIILKGIFCPPHMILYDY